MASVLASSPTALAKFLIWRGLTTASGRPAPASAAATVVSKPPVASRAVSEKCQRFKAFDEVLQAFSIAKASPDGRKGTSSRPLDTSMPTEFVTRRGSSMTLLGWLAALTSSASNRRANERYKEGGVTGW
jgi:hypothetical protein